MWLARRSIVRDSRAAAAAAAGAGGVGAGPSWAPSEAKTPS